VQNLGTRAQSELFVYAARPGSTIWFIAATAMKAPAMSQAMRQRAAW